MNITLITAATLAIIFVLVVTGVFMLHAIRTKDQNPAQWKTVKETHEWIDIDPTTGAKIKRTRIEFIRVRI